MMTVEMKPLVASNRPTMFTMRNPAAALLFFTLFASTTAFASGCVKVRDGKDAYECMRFSKAEKFLASKYGLGLAMKYQAMHSLLLKNGWEIDREWINENARGVEEVRPVCGSGYDAVCSISYSKEKRKISAYLSGVNDGLPLIGIEEDR
jgi:hypothetical protein